MAARLKIIRIPKTPANAFDKHREISDLVRNQVRNAHQELHAWWEKVGRIAPEKILTEQEAARYTSGPSPGFFIRRAPGVRRQRPNRRRRAECGSMIPGPASLASQVAALEKRAARAGKCRPCLQRCSCSCISLPSAHLPLSRANWRLNSASRLDASPRRARRCRQR